MQIDDPEFQYVGGQLRPGFATLLADYDALGAQAVAAGPCALDLRYGAAPRQRFDFFPAQGRPCATLAYFHAGYWQSRDKSGFRFIAPPLTRRGVNVALVNYPLCPTVSLAELTASVQASVAAIRAHAAALGQDETAWIAAGHSAGGHIAVELALTASLGVAGVIALSGIYDLSPLVATSLNARLQLDGESARAASPLWRVAPHAPPALFAVGGDETPAFVDQSRRMHEAWRGAGNDSAFEIVAGADHFSLLRDLTTPGGGALDAAVDALLARARRRFESGAS